MEEGNETRTGHRRLDLRVYEAKGGIRQKAIITVIKWVTQWVLRGRQENRLTDMMSNLVIRLKRSTDQLR